MHTKYLSTALFAERGSILLEALIGILVFSLGVLGLVGLQAASIKNTSEARYRTQAAYLTDQLIAQMWVDNKVTLTVNYASPSGSLYVTWRNVIAPTGG